LKIPLPKYIETDTKRTHAFPFLIGSQTLEFLQGSIFYASFSDMAAGEYVRIPGAMARIETRFLEEISRKDYDASWKCLEKYKMIFENMVFSNVLIMFCSHWDWYIRRLSDFIIFALNYAQNATIPKDLSRIENLPILIQIETLEKACGLKFSISQDERSQLKEMTLVRNLGLHNRWEIDEKYLLNSDTKGFEIGDIRFVRINELRNWHQILISLISETSIRIAKLYYYVPEFK
jgi:hypothetical protein